MFRFAAAAVILAAVAATPAAADDDRPPPAGATPLSRIVAQVEARPDCHFIKEIEWDDGRYKIEYRTRDGRDREVRIDPTGPMRK